jgi:selenide,water dikinase
MCRASGVGAEIDAGAVPALSPEVFGLIARDCVPGGTRANLQSCEGCVTWGDTPEPRRVLLADAQTSGGLLLCVPPRTLRDVQKLLKRHRTPAAAVVGRVVRSKERRILVRP